MTENNNLSSQIKDIPKLPGVYLMRDTTGQVIYVGKAKNLCLRIKSYFIKNEDFRLIGIMFYNVRSIDYIVCASEKEALLLEQRLIKELQPKYNIIWKDDKSYLMLELDLSDPFPKLNFIRYKEYLNLSDKPKTKVYFGPYTSSKQIKSAVKFITKFFKVRRCKYDSKLFFNPKLKDKFKTCIYYQTNQCLAPCIYASEDNKEIINLYKQVIKNIILFLQGKNKKLISKLERQMQEYSKKLNFEQAMVLRDIIKYLSNIFSKCIIREINKEDVVTLALHKIDILKKLKEKFKLKTIPHIIEAVDISTFQGVGSCGSIVRFVNAQPDKSEYRRYKIKSLKEDQINDYLMMKEVIKRRYKRLLEEKKQLPNLLLVDGGKGQLSSVLEILKEYKIDDKIEVLALAKKEDCVYSKNFELPIKLSKTSEDNILRYIRDEAHRFAIKYNKLLFKKRLEI
ncbi:MAG: GIY-YIG nuclease family protein [Endomicrobiia bacterium]